MTVHIAIRTHSSFRAWVLGLFCALSSIGFANAQSCAAPYPIPVGMVSQVDTCSTPNSLPIIGGVVPSPHNDAVFRLQITNEMYGIIDVQASFQVVVFLIPSPCDMNTAPIQVALPGEQIVIGASTPAGAYYLIASGHPELSAPGCGMVQLTPTIVGSETIFLSGFEIVP